MWRFLGLIVVAAPFLWTAHAEWAAVGAVPATGAAPATTGAPAVSSADARSQADTTSQQATEADIGYAAWASRALHSDGGPAAGKFPEGWKDLGTKTEERAKAFAAARDFARRYCAADPKPAAKDEPLFERALDARKTEAELLEKRAGLTDATPDDYLKTFDQDLLAYRKDHGEKPESNRLAVAVIGAWVEGNKLLRTNSLDERAKILRGAFDRTEKNCGQKLFEKTDENKFAEAAGRLSGFTPAPEALTDAKVKALAKRVEGEARDWRNTRLWMVDTSLRAADSPERLRDLAECVRLLRGTPSQPDLTDVRKAARALCEYVLPPRQGTADYLRLCKELLDAKQEWREPFLLKLLKECDDLGVKDVSKVCAVLIEKACKPLLGDE